MAVGTQYLAEQPKLRTSSMVLGAIAVAALLAAPFFFYPGLPDERAVLRALRLRVQPAHRLCRPAVLRPRRLLRRRRLFHRPCRQGVGLGALAAILLGVAGAAVMGLVIGFLAIRRQGIYFAMITLALSQMFAFICLQVPFTHGEDGIQGVPRGHLLGLVDLNQPLTMYYVTLAIFLFGFFAIWRIVNSPFGNILKAIRENEQRAVSLGYRVDRYKLGAFVMSAALAGLAGGTKAIVFQFATLTDVQWQMSGEVILMTLLGGIGTLVGPIVGAGLVIALQNYLAASDFPVTVLIGIIFVICVLLFRRGIVGEILELMKRRTKSAA